MNIERFMHSKYEELVSQEENLYAKRLDLEHFDMIMEQVSTQNIIRQMYIDFWFAMNSWPPNDRDFGIASFDGKKVVLKKHWNYDARYATSYEEIADKITSFGYGNTVKQDVVIERNIRGIEFVLEDFRETKIPDEEMELLRSLGKTKVNTYEASSDEAIFCEFN